jgi:DNA invertase Pin-like site-specific DNA recombinase
MTCEDRPAVYHSPRPREVHSRSIYSCAKRGLNTTTPAGKAMFQMMGVFAEFERAMIQERVRAGLARARSEGKRLGRPPIAPALEKRIREALATPGRPGIRVIAEQFGVNPSTVQRISASPFGTGAAAVGQ